MSGIEIVLSDETLERVRGMQVKGTFTLPTDAVGKTIDEAAQSRMGTAYIYAGDPFDTIEDIGVLQQHPMCRSSFDCHWEWTDVNEPNLQATIAIGIRDNIIERLSKIITLVARSSYGGVCVNCQWQNAAILKTCEGDIALATRRILQAADNGQYTDSWLCDHCGALMDTTLPKAWIVRDLDRMVGNGCSQFNSDDLGLLLLCWKNVARLDPTMMRVWYYASSGYQFKEAAEVHSTFLLNTYNLLESLGIE